MKNKLIKILLATMCLFTIVACDNYGQFEKELYEKNIYIISENNYNIFSLTCDFSNQETKGNISIAVSGTNKIDKDVTITFAKDEVLLPVFNYSNFEIRTDRYAHELDQDRYTIPSMTMTLKANKDVVFDLFPININADDLLDLSPDSTYFISLTIDKVSDYAINAKKKNVLVRIDRKNKYATLKKPTNYGTKGFTGTSETDLSPAFFQLANKLTFPLSKNSVRMYVEAQSPVNPVSIGTIDRYGMRITVNEDKTLTLEPYSPDKGLLELEQLPIRNDIPDYMYTNTYEEYPDPIVVDRLEQRFRMHYRYRSRAKETDGWSAWRYIEEIASRADLVTD